MVKMRGVAIRRPDVMDRATTAALNEGRDEYLIRGPVWVETLRKVPVTSTRRSMAPALL